MTPVDRGVCYHCHSPLPSTVALPPGTIVCPNCLKVTPVDTGYCRHCRARLPTSYAPSQPPPQQDPNPTLGWGTPGVFGRVITVGALPAYMRVPRRVRIV